MRTSAAGNSGLTLLELLIVVAIMALATAGVSFAIRDSAESQLEREAQRLAILLETARAQSHLSATPVRWQPTATGFSFEGLPGSALPSHWLGNDVRVVAPASVLLGPEPIIGPQRIRLVSLAQPQRGLTVATDGVRPFTVLTD